MTDDKLNTSLSANTIMAKLTNQFQRTRHITSSPDKHNSLDSEDDFRSGCRNVSHQQQFFSELPSPGRSHYTNYLNPDTPGFKHLQCVIGVIFILRKLLNVKYFIKHFYSAGPNTSKIAMNSYLSKE